jgi:predicted dehydrogenase
MPALLALPDFDIIAVCTIERESAEAAERDYEARRANRNFRDLVADPDVSR